MSLALMRATNYAHAVSHSRGTKCPKFYKKPRPPQNRGRREDRVRAAPAVSRARCTEQERTRAYRFSGNTPAFPAQWFYGLYRALPGDRALLPPSPLRSVCFSKDLMPASRHQDHTILPYAWATLVSRSPHVHRISIHGRDDRDRPSFG